MSNWTTEHDAPVVASLPLLVHSGTIFKTSENWGFFESTYYLVLHHFTLLVFAHQEDAPDTPLRCVILGADSTVHKQDHHGIKVTAYRHGAPNVELEFRTATLEEFDGWVSALKVAIELANMTTTEEGASSKQWLERVNTKLRDRERELHEAKSEKAKLIQELQEKAEMVHQRAVQVQEVYKARVGVKPADSAAREAVLITLPLLVLAGTVATVAYVCTRTETGQAAGTMVRTHSLRAASSLKGAAVSAKNMAAHHTQQVVTKVQEVVTPAREIVTTHSEKLRGGLATAWSGRFGAPV
mmetsp:Transcript_33358/g.81376  ORF Transcript_33358/g.81376 Transcript_33358/m.81376 type:complete len:298 (+) Transcript_33358:37-930(+)